MMTYFYISLAAFIGYVLWKMGYSYGHWKGLIKGYDLGRGSQNTYIIEQQDNQWEFKKHKMN